ncbi:pre-toxin TG domain-containing protein [Fusobacterium polymorphum]|uniref:pre-toxin TG domain-containing protein n=2 Tax=Fusobacterium nucleatum subsp. polymorphum TaxID=76857 RepID=UPI0030CD0800
MKNIYIAFCIKNLRAQRWTTSFYNVTGSRMEELSRQFKAREIDEKQLKEAVRELAKGYGKDIGIDFEVVYLDEKTMPKDSEGSTGSAYIVDKENKRVLIPIDIEKIKNIGDLFGTLIEEISHGKDALKGRQDKKVAEDKSNDEEGLESLGRPANDYVKNKLGEDNNSKIKLSTDGIDLSNADVGEKVGNYLPKHEIDAAGGVEKVLRFETSEEIAKTVRHRSGQEVFNDFYQVATNKTLWSTIYDFTPILGDGKGFVELLTGEDTITGEKLNMFQRIIGGIPLIHQAGEVFTFVNKPIKKGADFFVNLILDSSKGISKLDNVNDTAKLATVAEGVGDSSNITKSVAKEIKIADDTADIAKASKNVEKISDVSKSITDKVKKSITRCE